MRFKILLIFPFLLTISVSNGQNINSNIFKISTDSISSRNLLATFKRDSLVDIPKKQKKIFTLVKKLKKDLPNQIMDKEFYMKIFII